MTETACVISMTTPGDHVIGHVGGPAACCEIKLDDIPDMNYTHGDKPYPRGEVVAAPTLPHRSLLRSGRCPPAPPRLRGAQVVMLRCGAVR